jgi:hypothetical protein
MLSLTRGDVVLGASARVTVEFDSTTCIELAGILVRADHEDGDLAARGEGQRMTCCGDCGTESFVSTKSLRLGAERTAVVIERRTLRDESANEECNGE